MKKKRPGKGKKGLPSFGRALLPPEKFHSTKKGERGYRRDNQKKETLHVREEAAEETSPKP